MVFTKTAILLSFIASISFAEINGDKVFKFGMTIDQAKKAAKHSKIYLGSSKLEIHSKSKVEDHVDGLLKIYLNFIDKYGTDYESDIIPNYPGTHGEIPLALLENVKKLNFEKPRVYGTQLLWNTEYESLQIQKKDKVSGVDLHFFNNQLRTIVKYLPAKNRHEVGKFKSHLENKYGTSIRNSLEQKENNGIKLELYSYDILNKPGLIKINITEGSVDDVQQLINITSITYFDNTYLNKLFEKANLYENEWLNKKSNKLSQQEEADANNLFEGL